MTVFEKARELGAFIADSDAAVACEVARDRFLQDDEAVEIMKKYEGFQRDIETKMQKGLMTQEQFQGATEELKRLGDQVNTHPIAGAYIEAVANFNSIMDQVLGIIQKTAAPLEDMSGKGHKCGKGGCCGSGGGLHAKTSFLSKEV